MRLTAFLFAATLAGQSIPLPKVTGPVAVTKDSYPLSSASRLQTKWDLDGPGYLEEEYFLSGIAGSIDIGNIIARHIDPHTLGDESAFTYF